MEDEFVQVINIFISNSMKSPLRYIGGKSKATNKLLKIYIDNFECHETLFSPFCGGCSFEFFMKDRFKRITCCDLYSPLILFWNECKNNNVELIKELKESINTIDKEKFYAMRNNLNAMNYFIINRCSFSGSTMSGGFSQEAAEKRFTLSSIELIKQLQLDKYEFCDLSYNDSFDILLEPTDFIYCDPPYMIDNNLYGNNGDLHRDFDHQNFHDVITSVDNDWMISYNDCVEIRKMYREYRIIEVPIQYSAKNSKNSNEIVILSHKISIGAIPHQLGKITEMTIRDWFRNRGFNVKDQTAGSSNGRDVVIFHNDKEQSLKQSLKQSLNEVNEVKIEVECKRKVIGVDYIEFKLNYIDDIWQCKNGIIQEFLNDNNIILFNDENPLIYNFSSVDWNIYKENNPQFKDIHYHLGCVELSDYITADYIFFEDLGLYYLKEDILQINCPRFNCNNFEYRFYFKNHSGSRASKASISCNVTLRIKTDKGMRISNVRLNS
jgi:DNA adenine methylase